MNISISTKIKQQARHASLRRTDGAFEQVSHKSSKIMYSIHCNNIDKELEFIELSCVSQGAL